MRVRTGSERQSRARLLRVPGFIIVGLFGLLGVAASVTFVIAGDWAGWLAAEAGAAGQARRPVDPAIDRARDDIRHGRYGEAEQALQPLASAQPVGEAALELGLLEWYLGKREPSRRRLDRIAGAAKPGDAASLFRAARAAGALGRSTEANDLFRAAQALAPTDPFINTAWGDLFFAKFDPAEAMKSYRDALAADANYAPAHLGAARVLADEDTKASRAAAERALALDASLAAAHLLIAELALDESHLEEGRTAIDRALAINPQSLEARSLLAAVAYVQDRPTDFDAEVARVLAIHPTYGEVYRVAGQLAARNYRFEEAVVLVRRALALDSTLTRARADLGIHLLRTGDETAARESLTRAFDEDKSDFVTFNLLAMFDRLVKFKTIEEGSIVMRLHSDEAAVLREYAMPLAQNALKTLSARYEFTPKGPILVEVFPNHDDFAVRNVGLPGMIGALGACFGRVITMDSPRARDPGTFSWGATLWHEMAHVITLQMSNQRIPRWLTEGISVFEETRAPGEWGRDMDVAFAQALEKGQVLKLRDLNAGFTRGETIALAYYEASLLVEHIVSAYGEPALRKLVTSFRDGIDTEAALKRALGVEIDALQVEFDRALDKRFAAMRSAVRAPEALAKVKDVEALKSLAAAHPGSYPVHLALGVASLAADNLDGAIVAWEKAVTLLPMATGKDSARALLANALIKKGDAAKAAAVLEDLLARDHTDVESARQLAKLADAAADERRRWLAYERIVDLDPFDGAAHIALGRLALARKNAEVAIREHRAALASNPVDVAAAHCDLGESYLLAGRAGDAKKHVLAALEIAPMYDRAQDLLLKIVEPKR